MNRKKRLKVECFLFNRFGLQGLQDRDRSPILSTLTIKPSLRQLKLKK